MLGTDTAPHIGCEHGVCSAHRIRWSTFAATRACLVPAVQADGRRVETIERRGGPQTLHPIQAALSRPPRATMRILHAQAFVLTLSGCNGKAKTIPSPRTKSDARCPANLCRYTGYQGMVDAALEILPGAPPKT